MESPPNNPDCQAKLIPAPGREASALRAERLRARARERIDLEINNELALLAGREGHGPALEYFLNLLGQDLSPAALAERLGRKVVGLMCLQVPLELFLALDLQPLRLYGGALGAAKSAPPGLPALMCPLLRSLMGEMVKEPSLGRLDWVIPTTCDWVSGFESLRELSFTDVGSARFVELPRRKENPQASERWLSEVAGLWEHLKKISGRKAGRRELLAAVATMEAARSALGKLISLRRKGLVPAAYFFAIAYSFFFDSAQAWTKAVQGAADHFAAGQAVDQKTAPAGPAGTGPGLFLTGSPIVFPNFKLLHLLEELNLTVLGEDMCSGERLLFRHVAIKDTSEVGLLRALAETTHDGCLCPVFVENRRRLGPIMEAVGEAPIKGVAFHLLKGCHPYEMDSLTLEAELLDNGVRFVRLETDYTPEDRGNLMTRLEAFKSTL
ncbi:MAG: 2-hydroxyacyl-CoA dehydratase family protein [Deltaproteobacteria bacterium]|jgi:benzoyl-CoA reductase/2-hydroxyglutaryl-CoA dehydratase subunit BcrC/BadD/HgdB|nr:2-hydroxyacyl-CoA dehydratase family protein [Deltaproteobacteria bacterium]